jgi:hypothetical protein
MPPVFEELLQPDIPLTITAIKKPAAYKSRGRARFCLAN